MERRSTKAKMDGTSQKQAKTFPSLLMLMMMMMILK
jgi:hypothetical protein